MWFNVYIFALFLWNGVQMTHETQKLNDNVQRIENKIFTQQSSAMLPKGQFIQCDL